MNGTRIAILAALALALNACGGGEEEAVEEDAGIEFEAQVEEDSPPENIEDAFSQLGKALGGLGEDVETVAAKELKEMLPEKIGDLERTSYSAKKSGAFGIKISSAEAAYEGENGERIDLAVKDIGAMQTIAALGMEWVNVEVDEETQDGFTRSVEYMGHKAFQNFQQSGDYRQGAMSVFVGGRFVVDAKGENVDFETIEEAVDTVPVDELEKMRKELANE